MKNWRENSIRYNSGHNKMLFSPNTLFVLFSNFTQIMNLESKKKARKNKHGVCFESFCQRMCLLLFSF